MTMRQCPECSGEMSTRAAACPHCGHPAGLDPAKRAGFLTLGIMVVISVIVLLIMRAQHRV